MKRSKAVGDSFFKQTILSTVYLLTTRSQCRQNPARNSHRLATKTTNTTSRDCLKRYQFKIKAGILGIPAEDYYNDQVLDDVNLLHSGLHVLENEFWDTHSKNMTSWKEHGNTFYRIEVRSSTNGIQMTALQPRIINSRTRQAARRRPCACTIARDYTQTKHAVWCITARNREQISRLMSCSTLN